MLKLKKIAVTGGIACGKTTFCKYLANLGAHTVNADKIVHQLLSPVTNLGQKIINLVGPDVLNEGQINRSKIAQKVFENPEMLKELEHLIHPAVQKEIERQYQEVKERGNAPLFVAEIPLLFEVKGQDAFDKTIAIVADIETCKMRFEKTPGYDSKEFERRSSRQFTMQKKQEIADIVIKNNGSLQDLYSQAKAVFKQLTA